MDNQKTAIFLVNHPSVFRIMLKISIKLKSHQILPILLLEKGVTKDDLLTCKKHDVKYLHLSQIEKNILSKKNRKKTNSIEVLFRKITRVLLSDLKGIWMKKKLINLIFETFKPEFIILYSDRLVGYEIALASQAKSFNIPTLVIPAAYSHPSNPVKFREDKKVYWIHKGAFKWINIILKILLPHQSINLGKNGSYLFYPPNYTLVAWISRILPQNPWFIGGGKSSLVAVDSEETCNRYQKYGINPKKLIITGQPELDQLYTYYKEQNEIKYDMITQFKLDPNKKIIICALPQLGEHKLLPWKKHWEEINFLVKTISQLNTNVVISLHPKMNKEKYLFLEDKYSVAIANKSLNIILPAADIYIATFSSTIIWAILCEIPSIVVDFYGLNYSYYNKYKGVLTIRDRKDLKKSLEKLINHEKFYIYSKNEQKKSVHKIGLFDGKATSRIINIIKNK